MNIHEYQAAEILGRYGIPLNAGQAARTPDEAAAAAQAIGGTVAIKAQVHSGGRGKAGGIKLAKSPDEAREVAGRILGMDIRGHTVNTVLVVPGVSIAAEYYVGITLDRANRQIIVMASAEGGVEIEEVAHTNPEAILRIPVDPVRGLLNYEAVDLAFALGIAPDAVSGFVDIVKKMARAYIDEDASLVEINPLIRTEDGRWLALDSKMVLDDNALFRHPGARIAARHGGGERDRAGGEGVRHLVRQTGRRCRLRRQRRGSGDGDDGRPASRGRRAGELPRCRRRRERGAGGEGARPDPRRPACARDLLQHLRRHHARRRGGEGHHRGTGARCRRNCRLSSGSRV